MGCKAVVSLQGKLFINLKTNQYESKCKMYSSSSPYVHRSRGHGKGAEIEPDRRE
jgi:hypothetical protein